MTEVGEDDIILIVNGYGSHLITGLDMYFTYLGLSWLHQKYVLVLLH